MGTPGREMYLLSRGDVKLSTEDRRALGPHSRTVPRVPVGQDQNLALTVLFVLHSLDSRKRDMGAARREIPSQL